LRAIRRSLTYVLRAPQDPQKITSLARGLPLEEVSKALGHESIKTTEKFYAKWVKARQDRLDALIMGTWNI